MANDTLDRETDAKATRDALALPSVEKLCEIEGRQTERALEIRERRVKELAASTDQDDRAAAAALIQRNYRGYRERRALKGHGLDASTRWMEAMKDVRYERLTRPMSRTPQEPSITFADSPSPESRPTSSVRDRWRRVGAVAQRAGSDDTSDTEPELATQEEREKFRERKRAQKAQREKYARVMGLEYFLEMVDQKHRYGSNLRRYHQEWKKSDTRDNFFWWLDHGDGADLDLEDRPRKRLDTEQVRYLSREERKQYLVRIDGSGRFVWDKDSQPITTSRDFKDSINGVVPTSAPTPTWREVTTGEKEPPRPASSSSQSTSSSLSTGHQEDASKYANPELHDAHGLAKLSHLSVDSLTNHLLRKTTKSNTWIFVADTSFRLYVGIKQSGAFQHSSFLKGARVAAAGLIKIKRGQVRKLSPLSGHYAPPVRNFREFIRNLKAEGADLARLNVSRSYAVILGLEGYVAVKKKVGEAGRGMRDMVDREGRKRREEEGRDKSASAEKEREILAREERERKARGVRGKVKGLLGIGEEKEKEG